MSCVLYMLNLKYYGLRCESNQPSHHCKWASSKSNEGSAATERKVSLSKKKVLIARRIVEKVKKK
jgi:hypothetical protein